jgi:hypothetical protein
VRTHLLRHIRHKIPPVEGSQRAEHEILRLRVVVAAGPSLSRLKHSLESSCVVLCCVVLCWYSVWQLTSSPASAERASVSTAPSNTSKQAHKRNKWWHHCRNVFRSRSVRSVYWQIKSTFAFGSNALDSERQDKTGTLKLPLA